jgi:asparagine synthase (glutamine-hydrolysing)
MVFGSDMRIPILFHQDNRKLRVEALPEYLTYSYVVGEDTPLQNVKLLPEAHWTKINTENGRMEFYQYWNLGEHDGLPNPRTEVEAAEEAYSLLVDAVKKRLVADVPVSVMLSSGLDSSAIAYILAKELNAPLKTFSLGYADEDFDESNDAGVFARQMELPWQQLLIQGQDIAENFNHYIGHTASLQSNTAQLVYFFSNRMIHQAGFKVALNGAGGDELYAGYKTYQATKIFSIYRRLPGYLCNLAQKIVGFLPITLGRVSLDYMLQKFIECPYRSELQAHAYWRTLFSPTELQSLLSPDVIATMPSFTRAYDISYQTMGITDADINNLLRVDLKSWLIPMLPWVDNMPMAHSVELRLPFLDYRLVHRAVSLPSKFLFRGWKLKRIMKRYLQGRLPDEVVYRKKRGTHLPISKWLNNELSEIRDHYLDESTLNKDGLFNMDEVHRLITDSKERRKDNTFKLWSLIVLSAWMEYYEIGI